MTRPPLFPHQVEDIESLLAKPAYALFLKMRLGKSRITVEAAAQLFRMGLLNRAITTCPANVRSVWAADFGEIRRWWPDDLPLILGEYRGDEDLPMFDGRPHFQWLVTNAEFIRKGRRLNPLKEWAKARPEERLSIGRLRVEKKQLARGVRVDVKEAA